MSSILNSIIKLPRYVRILATNGVDETTAFVNDDRTKYSRQYYQKNRNRILEKKKIYNQKPDVKKHNADYHREYYRTHKEHLNRKRPLNNAKKNGMS